MSLQLVPKPQPANPDLHLTEDQFAELLATRASAPEPKGDAGAHLHTCRACAAELTGLRDSLALFQEASVALADREFAHLQHAPLPLLPMHRHHLRTTLWATAAAVLLAAFLPLETHRQQPLPPAHAIHTTATSHPAESDEALLEDISRDINASVPAPMQALADPTGNTSSTAIQTSNPPSDQRKD